MKNFRYLIGILFIALSCAKQGSKEDDKKFNSSNAAPDILVPPQTPETSIPGGEDATNTDVNAMGSILLKLPGTETGELEVSLYDSKGAISNLEIKKDSPNTYRFTTVPTGFWRMIIQLTPDTAPPVTVKSMILDPILVKKDETLILAPAEIPASAQLNGKAMTWEGSGGNIEITIDGTPYGATTDETGAWQITGIPAGNQTIRFNRDSYNNGLSIDYALNAGQNHVLDDMILLKTVANDYTTLIKDINKVDGQNIYRVQLVSRIPETAVKRRISTSQTDLNNATWSAFSSTFTMEFPGTGDKSLFIQYQFRKENEIVTGDVLSTSFTIQ